MKIEEITDEMARALEISEANKKAQESKGEESNESHGPSTAPAHASMPDLPPQLATNAGKSAEEIIADLNKSPLFMTEMEENDDIAALQALNYEGSPLENSTDFKIKGNECFKNRAFADAREFYGKGIQILFLEERKRAQGEKTYNEDGVEDSPEEISNQKEVLEALYVNRAACHLELRNYRSCWTDCAAALRLNPRNVKACYRSAKALLAVDRITEADDVCARGLALDPENKGLKAVATSIIERAEKVDAKRRKDEEREKRTKRREMLVRAALKARNIATRSTGQPPEMGDVKLELVPDPDDPRSSLVFPTVLLYPAHLETDFIKQFGETQTLQDHLNYVFPLPWDNGGEYTAEGTTCYVETKEGGLLKMGKKVPLLKILSTGKVEVVDEVVKIFVLPNAKAEAWVAKFKMQKAAELGKK